MDKRSFLKSLGVGSVALMQPPLASKAAGVAAGVHTPQKQAAHRVWINPSANDTEAGLRQRYAAYKKAGIGVIYFEEDSERHFRAAKEQGIEAHRWIWTMNRGEKELLSAHPEWYSQNRKGESCATNPPYVSYYRWLCPSKPEVLNYLEEQVSSILTKDYVDGIHLDYIRYCDVILPVNLWSKYSIDQSRELPEYDFCYCETCRNAYKAEKGEDPLEMEHPDQRPSWRKFRYDRITHIVNSLAQVAKQHKKPITAAVFPTPEIAKRIVRQDWTNWHLDAVNPMIYHGFYKEDVSWIGDAVAEGVQALHGRFPLYAGLFLPDFHGNMADLKKGIALALQNGAAGVSLFGNLTPEVLQAIS
ncbi:family 10 glycosylhydrolase [Chitinophaga japonensis]|uniref:Glycosyl hydrolase family 10 n=1 Tax=Chitinophaga japonensis TaxID=104662 RepID=A0A562TDG0_CHIJA|nr:family 10 glycosylhydrolase [Chitinophaga japonensis]TWI91549.1 glycosyl hydrolase family 10 [Chitinophaga japonensis]